MAATKTTLIRGLVKLRKEKLALEAKTKAVEAKIKAMEPSVLDWMQENSVSKVTQDGMTVHIRREVWASMAEGVEVDFLRDALEAAGIDPTTIIKERANTQTLSALIREFEADDRPLPNSLAAAVKVSEVFKLGFLSTDSAPRRRKPSVAEYLDDAIPDRAAA